MIFQPKMNLAKMGLAIALTFVISSFANAQAQEYICHKPGYETHYKYDSFPLAYWKWYHDTKNWKYTVLPGQDEYRKISDPSKTVSIRCRTKLGNPRYNDEGRYLHLMTDQDGNQDWCGALYMAEPEDFAAPSCAGGNGTEYHAKTGTCTRPNHSNGHFIQFGSPNTCPSGYTYILKSAPPANVPVAPIVTRIESPSEHKLTCPQGEFYRQKIYGDMGGGHDVVPPASGNSVSNKEYKFTLPRSASKLRLKFAAKPGNSTGKALVGFKMYDTVRNEAKVQYYTLGIPLTAWAPYTPDSNHELLVPLRWEKETIPNYTHMAFDTAGQKSSLVNLDEMIANHTAPNQHDQFEYSVMMTTQFGAALDVDYVKAEWCFKFNPSSISSEGVANKDLLESAISETDGGAISVDSTLKKSVGSIAPRERAPIGKVQIPQPAPTREAVE